MNISILLAAIILDLLIGDPRVKWHPVILIGNLIHKLDNLLRPLSVEGKKQKYFGALLVLIVLFITYETTSLLLSFAYKTHQYLGDFLAVALLSATISTKSLAEAGMEIYQLLLAGDIREARGKLAWIVGRDTHNLDEAEITRGTVETVAENIVDGIIAPLCFFIVGGVPLAIMYRAINTMDSMLGYKNEKYFYFGFAAAKLDDLANFLPARITGLMIIGAAYIMKLDFRRAWYTIARDAHKHPSPNSGISEAAVAGALGIRLGGQNVYQGVASFRTYMGDRLYNLEAQHIKLTVNIMYITVFLFTACVMFMAILS